MVALAQTTAVALSQAVHLVRMSLDLSLAARTELSWLTRRTFKGVASPNTTILTLRDKDHEHTKDHDNPYVHVGVNGRGV